MLFDLMLIEMMGKTLARFSILGVAQLDYMDLYKKLTVKICRVLN